MITIEYKSYEERDKLIEEAKRQGLIVIGIGDKGNGTGHIDFGTEEEAKPDFEDMQRDMLTILESAFKKAISQTDYIYVKAMDLQQDVRTLYPDILQYRLDLRNWKRIKEQQILNAKSINDLEQITFDDIPQNPRESLTAK